MGPRPRWSARLVAAYKKGMAHVLERLAVWNDPVARDGPAQMACDEALLAGATEPVLRIFRWAGPWVSLGYFVPWRHAAAIQPAWPVCRRWTGGGVVVHDGDFTFALTAPRTETWTRLRPEESYRVLHEAVAAALRAQGCAAILFDGAAKSETSCFARPVRYDVVEGGRKIAGGAQRRTKRGLLHQGSIHQMGNGADLAKTLAAALSTRTTTWDPPAGFEDEVRALVRGKYTRDDFLRREER